MTRRITFSAAHIEYPDAGKQTGHAAEFDCQGKISGHNYTLDVTVCGSIDPSTGIVVNIKEIDHLVRANVVDRVDSTLLNGANGPLAESAATGERVLMGIREMLADRLPASVKLAGLRLERTPLEVHEWNASLSAPGELLTTHVYEFSASHRLHSNQLSAEQNVELFGKCNYPNGHGHNYVLEVTAAGPVDSVSSRVIDPAVLDELVVREVVERYDHRNLNMDLPEFEGKIPSSEIVIQTIFNRLEGLVPPPARLYRVLLRETARNFFEYYGDK